MSAISVLILTRNEEVNIEECLSSVAKSNDIVVLDSFSDDRTVELAQARGARIHQRKFDNWAAHQNWAMTHLEFKHRWVFYLDADERMTPELWEEISMIAADSNDNRRGYFCGRINYFMGRPITHCYPPVPIMRFFQPPFIRYERLVNPLAVVRGETGYLKNRFLHYNFSKGLTEWIEKHNNYSLAEAQEALKVLDGSKSLASIFSEQEALRRVARKNLALRLPFRPMLKFIYLYFGKMGILDGRPGFTYCILQSIYEYLIDLKVTELRAAQVKRGS
jgi:glycosyltransferase involved in cell wall biosynthesis